MPEKVRSHEELREIKDIVAKYWAFGGFSIRKITDEFNKQEDYVKKYGTVSVSSVQGYVKEIRREFESFLDEDAIEKYTGEFVRKQFQVDEQIEKLRKVQELIDVNTGDEKQRELYLKFEREMHNMTMNQVKMMSDIELVLSVKKFAKKRRLQTETIKQVPEEIKSMEEHIKNKRGYKLADN